MPPEESVTSADGGTRQAAILASAGQRQADVLQSAGQREAAVLAAQGYREEEALAKIGQRRVNLVWEVTQATLAILVPTAALGASLYIVVAGPPDMKTAAFVLLGGAMNLVLGFYFSRTNHTKTGGVASEQHRGE